MAVFSYVYSKANDFPEQKVAPGKLSKEIRDSAITAELDGVTQHGNDDDVTIDFLSELTAGEEAILDGLVAAHGGTEDPIQSQALSDFLDENAIVLDAATSIYGPFHLMQTMINRREIFNDSENPLYIEGFTGLNSAVGNLNSIHGKTGWHNQEIKSLTWRRPKDLLIYYGWPNSFNSAVNQWNNEKVAQDMAKYAIVVFGAGLQDPGHGDYSNFLTIVARLKQLRPSIQLFGYIATTETKANFETKAGQWNTVGVHGIFMDTAGYDYGVSRATFNERVTFIHSQSVASVCFVNAWTMDHIIGTTNDPTYPNSTFNSGLVASALTEDDWYLLESLAVNTSAYAGTGNDGYEDKAAWLYRVNKAMSHRYTFGINIAGGSVIANGHASGDDLCQFGFVSALMACLDAWGTSDTGYGGSSAAVQWWDRPGVTELGSVYTLSPSVQNDVNDADVYVRFVENAKLALDFSGGDGQASSISDF